MTSADPDRIVLDDLEAIRLVSANRRIHHMVRAKVCAYWRNLAHDAALDVYGHADENCHWLPAAHIILAFRFPDRRRRDIGNLYPCVAKPLVDGLVDARVVPDDDDRHVIGPDLRRDPEQGPHRITITLHTIEVRV